VLTHSIVAGYLCFIFVSSNPSRPPTVTPPPLGFPSLSRGAVGQKKKTKRKQKESNPKKGTKKERESERKERPPHSPSGKREPLLLGARVLRRHNSPPIRPC
jgi:hypothetical protein